MKDDQGRLRDSVRSEDSQAESNLSYRRLRSPAASGQSLQIPPLKQTVTGWNDRVPSPNDIEVGGLKLSSLQQQGRAELLKRATDYSAQYRDVDLSDRDGQSIVCLLYTSPSPRDATLSRMPSSA